MALSRAAGLCQVALRTRWATLRLSSSVGAGGESPGDEKKHGRLFDLEAVRRERALRPPAERRQPTPARKVSQEQMQLNAEIGACASPEAVLALVSSRLAVFNGVNAATALVVVSRRVRQDKAAASWVSDDVRFAQLLCTAKAHFAQMAPQELSNSLYACGQLGFMPPAEWSQRFWHASAAKLGVFKPQELSNTLYACGQLGVTPPADWLAHYWDTSEPKLGGFKPQELGNTLYACGQLGVAPPAQWLQCYWHASSPKLREFASVDCSMTLYACGQLGIVPPTDWLQLYWQVTASALGRFKPQELSNTLHSCSKVLITPPLSWLERFWNASASKLVEFKVQELCNTIYASGQLSITPAAEWLKQFWPVSASKLREFKSQDFSNTLYGCAQLAIVPPAIWLEQYWHVSASKLEEFKAQELSNTLYACGQLGITPPADWLQSFWLASSLKLREFNHQDLSITLYSFAQLDIKPPGDWLRCFSGSLEQLLPEVGPQGVANSAHALATLGLWDAPLWPSLWKRLLHCLPCDDDLNPESFKHARQLYQVLQAAAMERPGLLCAPNPVQLAAARKSWIDGSVDASRSSKLHNQVSAHLTRMGVAHTNERWCERAERIIDIAIEGAGTPIALEVDGPHHFLQDGRQDGSTRLRNRMLAAHGWRVVVMDYRVWGGLNTQARREEYLCSLLDTA